MSSPASSSSPFQSPYPTYSECQQTFLRLAHFTDGPNFFPATAFVRQFNKTTACDHYHSFHAQRDHYRSKLGLDAFNRIIRCKETEQDAQNAESIHSLAVDSVRDELLATLGPEATLRYWLVRHPIIMAVPIIASLGIGYSIALGLRRIVAKK
jgi:hypothetical protein